MSSTFGKKFLTALFMPPTLVFGINPTVALIDGWGSMRDQFQLGCSLASSSPWIFWIGKITWCCLCLEDKKLFLILSVDHRWSILFNQNMRNSEKRVWDMGVWTDEWVMQLPESWQGGKIYDERILGAQVACTCLYLSPLYHPPPTPTPSTSGSPFKIQVKIQLPKIFLWALQLVSATFFFFNSHSRTFFHCFWRERKGERERSVNVREKHQLGASCVHPNWGLNQQPRYVPWLGIEPTAFCCMGQCSNQLSHASPGWATFFFDMFSKFSPPSIPVLRIVIVSYLSLNSVLLVQNLYITQNTVHSRWPINICWNLKKWGWKKCLMSKVKRAFWRRWHSNRNLTYGEGGSTFSSSRCYG